jgi:hypothetical protein
MDDDNTMVYNWEYSITDEPLNEADRRERRLGNGPLEVDQTTLQGHACNRGAEYLSHATGGLVPGVPGAVDTDFPWHDQRLMHLLRPKRPLLSYAPATG